MKKLAVVLVASFGLALAPAVVWAGDVPVATATATVVSGTWDAVVVNEQGSGTPVFTLKQEGDKLSGKYQGQFGEAPLTGTLNGNKITFHFTSADGLKMEYTGTVDGAAMKGTAKFGDVGEGTFTAKKRAK